MKNFILKIYFFQFFDDLILIYPLYTVMFIDSGIPPWQVATLLAVWAGTSMLCEVPSGVLADKYSRKNILFIGQLIRAVGYLIWLVFPNFWGFLIGFVLWGIKSALTSGTFQALIYDELKINGHEANYTKIIGRTKTLSFIAILFASILASPSTILGYPFILITSSLTVLISGVIITTIPRAPQAKSTGEIKYVSLLKDGMRTILINRNLFQIILFVSMAYALGGALDEYWTIFANGAGLPNAGLGIFLGIMSLTQAFSSFIAHRFKKSSNRFLYFLFFINGVILIIASYLFSLTALFLLIIFSFLFTIIHVVFDGKLQDAITSSTRATITSVNGFLTEIGAIAVFVFFGVISQISNYQTSFFLFGCIIVIFGLYYYFFSKEKT